MKKSFHHGDGVGGRGFFFGSSWLNPRLHIGSQLKTSNVEKKIDPCDVSKSYIVRISTLPQVICCKFHILNPDVAIASGYWAIETRKVSPRPIIMRPLSSILRLNTKIYMYFKDLTVSLNNITDYAVVRQYNNKWGRGGGAQSNIHELIWHLTVAFPKKIRLSLTHQRNSVVVVTASPEKLKYSLVARLGAFQGKTHPK